jgi:hypothetical protein
MAKIGKKCPGCGKFVQKTEGCHIMMYRQSPAQTRDSDDPTNAPLGPDRCGTNAHGRVNDAMRNGGCACIFDWNTLKPIEDGHGYHNEKNVWVRTKHGDFGSPANDRQILFKR